MCFVLIYKYTHENIYTNIYKIYSHPLVSVDLFQDFHRQQNPQCSSPFYQAEYLYITYA